MNYFVFFFFLTTNLFAQVYDWNKSVEQVLNNNTELKTAIAIKQSRESLVNGSYNGYLPTVQSSLTYNYRDTSDGIYGASINVSQNLFSGFYDQQRIKLVKANSSIENFNVESVLAKLSYDLKSAFVEMTYASDYIQLTKEILHRRKENLKLVQLRFSSGRENKGSVLLSQAYYDQAVYDDLQTNNGKKIARLNLSKVMGLDEFSEFEVAGQVPKQEPTQNKKLQIEDLVINHPDYKIQEQKEQSALYSRDMVKSNFFPKLDLTGSLNRSEKEFFPNQNEDWTIGVNLTFPLFNGGEDFYQTQSATFDWMAAVQNKRQVNRSLKLEIEKAYTEFLEAVAKFRVDNSFRLAAQARAEIARKKYNNGLITFEDWDIIENDLIGRQKNYLISEKQRVIAEAAWERAQGTGVFE